MNETEKSNNKIVQFGTDMEILCFGLDNYSNFIKACFSFLSFSLFFKLHIFKLQRVLNPLI